MTNKEISYLMQKYDWSRQVTWLEDTSSCLPVQTSYFSVMSHGTTLCAV